MNLPPNTNKVAPGHTCDVCQKALAKYYNTTWYIHICSTDCLEKFIEGYNKEIDNFTIVRLKPDEKDDV